MASPPTFSQRLGSPRKNEPEFCLPLPKETAALIGQQQQTFGRESIAENLGLWIDRLIPVNRADQEPWGLRGEARQQALSSLCRHYDSSAGKAALVRQREAILHTYSGFCRSLRGTQRGRLLVDAGRAHPLATSLSFHPVWGVPRIAGSAVKGAVLSLARAEKAERVLRAMGSKTLASDLVFFDALPVDGKFELALDVLTPHYGDYYQKKGPPSERLSPKPHTFLTVVQTKFEFWVAIDPEHPDAMQALADTLECLERVITEWGVGGKTSAGYGRFAIQQGAHTP